MTHNEKRKVRRTNHVQSGEEEEMQLMKDGKMKRWRTSEMSAVAQQARPWGIACGVLFDFLCEDGFLVVFCCRLLPLLSPGCVGGR